MRKYKYKYLVIDGSNLWHRVYASVMKDILKDKTSIEELEEVKIYTPLIQEMIYRLNNLHEEFGYKKSTKVFILFDNPFSAINIRKVISSGEYKHTRQTKVPKNIHKALNLMEEVLKCYSDSFMILRSEHLEADDLTLPVSKFVSPSENNRVLFISADLDWARNIGEYAHWYNFSNTYDGLEFKKKYGFIQKGNALKIYKALRGDHSDNIKPGVPYLPNKILLDIIEKFEDVRDMYSHIWTSNIPDYWKQKIEENKTNVIINYQLVDFVHTNIPIEDFIIQCKENIIKLRIWFDILEIPYESRMIDKENMNKKFFEKKRYTRRKKF